MNVGCPLAGSDSSNLCNPTVADLNPTWRGLCSNLGISNDSDCAGYWQGINANGLAAYGPLAATAMDADFQMLAKSGEQGSVFQIMRKDCISVGITSHALE